MGLLIIDGNKVYEIDEECMKRRRPPKECEVYTDYQQHKERPKDSKPKE